MKKLTEFFVKKNNINNSNEDKSESKTNTKSSSLKDRVLSIFKIKKSKGNDDLQATLNDDDIPNLTNLTKRTSMDDGRLSDLGIIKMAPDANVDYNLIIDEFLKQKDRRLQLI